MVGEVSWGDPQLTGRSTNQRWYGRQDNDVIPANTQGLIRTGENRMNPPAAACPAGDNSNCAQAFHSFHEGGAHFLFGDGSVRFISENIEHTEHLWDADNPFDMLNGGRGYGLWQRLHSRNDNLPIGEF
jgi:prepilin-type processing-associated H-X9-DG protein